MYHLPNVHCSCPESVKIEMFPCSALQKPNREQQAKTLTWRCEGAYSNRQTWRGFSKTCSWRTSLAVPASTAFTVRRMLRKGSFNFGLLDITFSSLLLHSEQKYLMKRQQVSSPAVAPLLTCACLPLPGLHATHVS